MFSTAGCHGSMGSDRPGNHLGISGISYGGYPQPTTLKHNTIQSRVLVFRYCPTGSASITEANRSRRTVHRTSGLTTPYDIQELRWEPVASAHLKK